MTVPVALAEFHRVRAVEARNLYQAGLSPSQEAVEWHEIKGGARQMVVETMRATKLLTDVEASLTISAKHIFVLRRLLAPPISQDKFVLLCPGYSKSQENNESPVSGDAAIKISAVFSQWRDKRLTRWIDLGRKPTLREIRFLVETASLLIAAQSAATVRRNLLSDKQETAVVELLQGLGWIKRHSSLVTVSSQLGVGEFLHKTRFATKTSPQEVDIACGLKGSVVLAMECKVTNDETNSIKRVNDVLKKATAWQDHWGSFVRTAALLQGVIKYSDVERLLAANVEVFWSHRLDEFEAWLARESE